MYFRRQEQIHILEGACLSDKYRLTPSEAAECVLHGPLLTTGFSWWEGIWITRSVRVDLTHVKSQQLCLSLLLSAVGGNFLFPVGLLGLFGAFLFFF